MNGECEHETCTRPKYCRGFCTKHYQQLRRDGALVNQTDESRFWSRVCKERSCWEWTGDLNAGGYGRFYQDGGMRPAHRISWELENGPVADGLVIDHRCHNPKCVRPSHLQAVSQRLNQENRRGAQRGNTSGIRGVSWHPGTQKWVVRTQSRGKSHYGGIFAELHDAEAAAVALRNQLFTNNLADRKAA